MGKVFELIFDVVYLFFMLVSGSCLLLLANGDNVALLFGAMAFILGVGDIFHLMPRIYTIVTGKANASAVGLGKLIASITATIYYLLLYYVWLLWVPIDNSCWRAIIWFLALTRILLCLAPANNWFCGRPHFCWVVLRNIPFVVLGLFVAYLFFACGSSSFHYLPLAILLSFLCYLPAAFFASQKPVLGMLMIPKTLAYVWIQIMGMCAVL